jgi:hypothetical protein
MRHSRSTGRISAALTQVGRSGWSGSRSHRVAYALVRLCARVSSELSGSPARRSRHCRLRRGRLASRRVRRPRGRPRREQFNAEDLMRSLAAASTGRPRNARAGPTSGSRVAVDVSGCAREGRIRISPSVPVAPWTGLPLYLVYGTGHENGVQVLKDAMWDVDDNNGTSFRDPRPRGGQLEGQQPRRCCCRSAQR